MFLRKKFKISFFSKKNFFKPNYNYFSCPLDSWQEITILIFLSFLSGAAREPPRPPLVQLRDLGVGFMEEISILKIF
jgi:hypothetical protein